MDLFDEPNLKPPVFEKKVMTLLDDMTSTEFDSYFLNNFLFDKECTDLEVILRDYKSKNNLQLFKEKIEKIKADEKLLISKKILNFMKSNKKYSTYNISLLEKAVDKYFFVSNLRYNINHSENNTSILQLAVQWKQPEIVKYLIEKGANINYLSENNGYEQSILSYLVMCNCQHQYMPDLKKRIYELLIILNNNPILNVKPSVGWDLRKAPYDRLDIFGININPMLIKDILFQLEVNVASEDVGEEGECFKDTFCTEIDIRKGIEKYLPYLLLDVNDSSFIKEFLLLNYADINAALTFFHERCESKIQKLERNSEKQLRTIADNVKHDDITRALTISIKTKILKIDDDTVLHVLKGYVPRHLDLVLQNIEKINLKYKSNNEDLATLCLDGISEYTMSIRTVFEKLKILFEYAKNKLDGPIFDTIRPTNGYTYFTNFMNQHKNNGVLVMLLKYSSGMGLEGRDKEYYFEYVEKIIRLIMKYDTAKEVIRTSNVIMPYRLMLQYIRLLSSELLSDIYFFINSKIFFDLSVGYVLEFFYNHGVIENKKTLETYFKLVTRDVLLKEIFNSPNYETYMDMVKPLSFETDNLYKYLDKNNDLTLEKAKFINKHTRINHKNISWSKREIADALMKYSRIMKYGREDLKQLTDILGMNVQDKMLDRIYKKAKKKEQNSSKPYKLKF